MRVCPKCGFVDPPYWLPSRWRITDYCRIEDLEPDQPHVADSLKQVKPMEIIENGFYLYRMNEAGFVERIWKKLGKPGFNLSREAHHFNPEYKHPFQRRLLDEKTQP